MIVNQGVAGTFSTGVHDTALLVGLGMPGPYNQQDMRIAHEEARSNNFEDEIRRIKQRLTVVEQRDLIFGAGGW